MKTCRTCDHGRKSSILGRFNYSTGILEYEDCVRCYALPEIRDRGLYARACIYYKDDEYKAKIEKDKAIEEARKILRRISIEQKQIEQAKAFSGRMRIR